MKRQKKQHRHKSKRTRTAAQARTSAIDMADDALSRRSLLKRFRTGGIVAVVAAGGGWALMREVQATVREHDLSRIGNGKPAVVQIHDPECPRCVALQREARDAVCAIGEDRLQFLVANIHTAEGRRLANAHGVGHVTLLLLDGAGQRKRILAGPRESEELIESFQYHVTRYAREEGS